MRDYAAVPHEYYEEMADLTDEEWGRLIRALLRYSIHGEETQLTGNERFFYRRVINREHRYQSSFEDTIRKLSEAGKKGAEKRWGNSQAIGAIGLDGHTETNTKTKTNTNTNTKSYSKTKSPSSEDERRFDERLNKDILELERFARQVQEKERDAI